MIKRCLSTMQVKVESFVWVADNLDKEDWVGPAAPFSLSCSSISHSKLLKFETMFCHCAKFKQKMVTMKNYIKFKKKIIIWVYNRCEDGERNKVAFFNKIHARKKKIHFKLKISYIRFKININKYKEKVTVFKFHSNIFQNKRSTIP